VRFAALISTVRVVALPRRGLLSATLCLCQALFVAVAYRLELNVDEIHEQAGFDD